MVKRSANDGSSVLQNQGLVRGSLIQEDNVVAAEEGDCVDLVVVVCKHSNGLDWTAQGRAPAAVGRGVGDEGREVNKLSVEGWVLGRRKWRWRCCATGKEY